LVAPATVFWRVSCRAGYALLPGINSAGPQWALIPLTGRVIAGFVLAPATDPGKTKFAISMTRNG
jgi:hypothetical protein